MHMLVLERENWIRMLATKCIVTIMYGFFSTSERTSVFRNPILLIISFCLLTKEVYMQIFRFPLNANQLIESTKN